MHTAAGGCTTTREALEVGAVVVTLPARYLGGRWSLAYLTQMGVLDTVAKDKDDYVRIAVNMGTDGAARAHVQDKVRANFHKLLGSETAPAEWAKLIKQMANG